MHVFLTVVFYCSQMRKFSTISHALISSFISKKNSREYFFQTCCTVSHWTMTPVMYFNTFKWLPLSNIYNKSKWKGGELICQVKIFSVLIHLLKAAISGSMAQNSKHWKYIFSLKKSTLFHFYCVIIVSWGQTWNIFEQLIWKLIPVISSPPLLSPFGVCRF